MAKRNALVERMRNRDHIVRLSDGELIDAVVEELAADLEIGSRQGVLLDELLHRFQNAIGLDETPKGITRDGEPVWPDVIGEDHSNATES